MQPLQVPKVASLLLRVDLEGERGKLIDAERKYDTNLGKSRN